MGIVYVQVVLRIIKKIMKIININNNNNIKFINSIIIYENTNIDKIGILKLTKTDIYI